MPALPWFAALDTETTGYADDPDARVIEVGIAVFDASGEPCATYEKIVNPGLLTEEGARVAAKVSGITREQILAGADLATVLLEVERVLCPGTTPLPVFGWNVAYDRELWRRTFFRGDLDEERAERLDPVQWHGDVMRRFSETFRSVLGDHPSGGARYAKLKWAAERSGLSWEGNHHRALADALMTGRILVGLERHTIVPPGASP